jgi:hypothetical protein
MTQLFGRFSAPSAPVHLPGAAFVTSALLTAACFVAYWWATREPVGQTGIVSAREPAEGAASS